MYKLKELEMADQVTFGNAENVTFETIQGAMTQLAQQNGIPISFHGDTARDGGIFGNTMPCLVVTHPMHQRDYFNLVLVLTKQGTMGSIGVYSAGKSKQMNKHLRSDISKGAASSALLGGGSYAVGAAIGGALGSIGKSKAKLQEEQMWYDTIFQLIGAVVFA